MCWLNVLFFSLDVCFIQTGLVVEPQGRRGGWPKCLLWAPRMQQVQPLVFFYQGLTGEENIGPEERKREGWREERTIAEKNSGRSVPPNVDSWPCVAEFMLWIQADRNVVVNTHFSSLFCHPIFSSVCWWIEMFSESKVNDAASGFPAWMWHWNNVKAIWVMRWQWEPTSPHLFLFVCFVLCSHRPLLFISLFFKFYWAANKSKVI